MMTKLRESVITKLCLMLSFSAFLALQSCSPDDPAHEATAIQPTGEELFAAIFFGYGEAAEHLSIYNEQRAKLGQISEADKKDVEQRLNSSTLRLQQTTQTSLPNSNIISAAAIIL